MQAEFKLKEKTAKQLSMWMTLNSNTHKLPDTKYFLWLLRLQENASNLLETTHRETIPPVLAIFLSKIYTGKKKKAMKVAD